MTRGSPDNRWLLEHAIDEFIEQLVQAPLGVERLVASHNLSSLQVGRRRLIPLRPADAK